jgi:hypothetical protein
MIKTQNMNTQQNLNLTMMPLMMVLIMARILFARTLLEQIGEKFEYPSMKED